MTNITIILGLLLLSSTILGHKIWPPDLEFLHKTGGVWQPLTPPPLVPFEFDPKPIFPNLVYGFNQDQLEKPSIPKFLKSPVFFLPSGLYYTVRIFITDESSVPDKKAYFAGKQDTLVQIGIKNQNIDTTTEETASTTISEKGVTVESEDTTSEKTTKLPITVTPVI